MTEYSNRFDDATIRAHAFALWESRGRPSGSPEVDWFEAERLLAAEAHAAAERDQTVRIAAERAAEAAIERARAAARKEEPAPQLESGPPAERAPSSVPPRNALLHVVPKEPLSAPKVPAIAAPQQQPKAAGQKRKR